MDNFSYFSLKPYVVTPHLNRLETVQIRGHNTCFYAELTKFITNYHQIISRALFFDILFASLHNVALPKCEGLKIRKGNRENLGLIFNILPLTYFVTYR